MNVRDGFTLTRVGRRYELRCDRCDNAWTITAQEHASAIARRHDQRAHGATS